MRKMKLPLFTMLASFLPVVSSACLEVENAHHNTERWDVGDYTLSDSLSLHSSLNPVYPKLALSPGLYAIRVFGTDARLEFYLK